MRQREALMVFGAVLLAVAVAVVLSVGVATAEPGLLRPRIFVGSEPPPAARPLNTAERQVPFGARALVPVQRRVSDSAAGAAGYLLVLVGVSAAAVLARGPVLASYRSAMGGWQRQLRILGAGLAVGALVLSTAFLCFVVLLNVVAGSPMVRAPFGPQPLLQGGLTAISVAFVFVTLAACVGLSAASWRLGDSVLGLPWIARWSEQVPDPVVVLIGATVIYLATLLPFVGPFLGLGAIAYALGAVITARLGQPNAHPAMEG